MRCAVYDPASVVFINASDVGPGEEELNFLEAFEQAIKTQQPGRGPISLKEFLHGFGTPHTSPARDDVTELMDLSFDTSKPLKILVIVDETQVSLCFAQRSLHHLEAVLECFPEFLPS